MQDGALVFGFGVQKSGLLANVASEAGCSVPSSQSRLELGWAWLGSGCAWLVTNNCLRSSFVVNPGSGVRERVGKSWTPSPILSAIPNRKSSPACSGHSGSNSGLVVNFDRKFGLGFAWLLHMQAFGLHRHRAVSTHGRPASGGHGWPRPAWPSYGWQWPAVAATVCNLRQTIVATCFVCEIVWP